MSAADTTEALAVHAARELLSANEHDLSDTTRGEFLAHITAAADVLVFAFDRHPLTLPEVTRRLGEWPGVRRGDLRAAADIAAECIVAATDLDPLMLDPRCAEWIADAVEANEGADRDRVVAALACDTDAGGRPTRPGLTVDPDLIRTHGDRTPADALAERYVRTQHARAQLRDFEEVNELYEMVRPLISDAPDASFPDAVERLDGDDRIRAEELLARQASVIAGPRTPEVDR